MFLGRLCLLIYIEVFKMDYFCKCCHGQFRRFCGANLKTGAFINGMRAFVCFLNICPMYTVNFEMIEYMKNDMDKFIYKCMLNFFCGMALLSYWTASLRLPKTIPPNPIHPSMQNNENTCNKSKSWKPDRAHYCSYCGRVIAKMRL